MALSKEKKAFAERERQRKEKLRLRPERVGYDPDMHRSARMTLPAEEGSGQTACDGMVAILADKHTPWQTVLRAMWMVSSMKHCLQLIAIGQHMDPCSIPARFATAASNKDEVGLNLALVISERGFIIAGSGGRLANPKTDSLPTVPRDVPYQVVIKSLDAARVYGNRDLFCDPRFVNTLDLPAPERKRQR